MNSLKPKEFLGVWPESAFSHTSYGTITHNMGQKSLEKRIPSHFCPRN